MSDCCRTHCRSECGDGLFSGNNIIWIIVAIIVIGWLLGDKTCNNDCCC